MSSSRVPAVLAALLCAACLTSPAGAGPLDRLKNKAKQKVDRAVDKKVDREMDDAIECAMGDQKCAKDAESQGKKVVIVDAQGNPVGAPAAGQATAASSSAVAAPAPGTGVWRNYDYTPGRDVWRHVVFDDERVGRFPAGQLEFVRGNMQVVELNGKRVLEVSTASVFRIKLDKVLPPDFTLEFDLRIGASNMQTMVYFSPLETAQAAYDGHYLALYHSPGVFFKGNAVSSVRMQESLVDKMTPVRFQADGEYAILYVGAERAANMPNAKFPRSSSIEFHVNANANYRSYIGEITVAVGVDDMYDALTRTGAFTTRGIYFDVGSHAIRPESTPTLIEIEETLKQHPELRVRIEGHTDSTGEDADNLRLSARRAQAVVDHLVAQGIPAARLEPAGKGEGVPVADNATPAGRQQNRRVVVVRKE